MCIMTVHVTLGKTRIGVGAGNIAPTYPKTASTFLVYANYYNHLKER